MIKKKFKVATCLALILSIPNLSYAEQANPESSVTAEISAEKSSDALTTPTKEVVVTGYGLNHEQALKNALQSAVEQEVGVLIDSETVINNNEIIKNEILTASNGFVEKFDEISTSQNNGLIELKIKAKVKSQAVSEKIKSLNIASIEVKNSSNLYAETVTKSQSKEDRQIILNKIFEGFFSQESLSSLLKIKLDDFHIKHDEATNEKVPVTIKYSLSFDNNSYSSKIDNIEKTLKEIGATIDPAFDFPEAIETLELGGGLTPTGRKNQSLHPKNNLITEKNKENNIYITVKNNSGVYVTHEWKLPNEITLNKKEYSSKLAKEIKIQLLDKDNEIINGSNERKIYYFAIGSINDYKLNDANTYDIRETVDDKSPAIILPFYGEDGYYEINEKNHEMLTADILVPIESINSLKNITISF